MTLLRRFAAYNRSSTVANSTFDIERMLPATLTFPDTQPSVSGAW